MTSTVTVTTPFDDEPELIAETVESVLTEPTRKGGRKTKRAELMEFVKSAGLNEAYVDDYLGGNTAPEELPSAEEIRTELVWRLLTSVRKGELKGIAYVQGLKAIESIMSRPVETNPDDDTTQVSLLDRIDALPRDHALELLADEVERLQALMQAHLAAFQRLEEEEHQ